MMEQTVRPLTALDLAAVAELEREARTALLEQRGGPAHLAERAEVGDWAAVLADPRRAAWVSTIDEVVVGYLELAFVGPVAEVMQVYVHPDAREVGFGDWMLEAALAEARARGCTTIEGTALPGDRHTKNLYERAGITARKITLAAPL